ncbi:hypothetical protein [Paenibacillus chitinolyticus]|uniref:hypothetical protein n=1 Tax=Paenibacillus chitinolyticus TaxID=79263 RepID=UPI00367168A1
MDEFLIPITVLSFLCTLLFIFWRPDIDEDIPATVRALIILLSGSVSLTDLGSIIKTIGRRSRRITISWFY